jgi:hypothetical protein
VAKAKTDLNIKSLLVRFPFQPQRLTDTGRTIEEKRWQTATVKTQSSLVRTAAALIHGQGRDVVPGRLITKDY